MEALNLWLPTIAVGIFAAIAISAWFADRKIAAVWFGFACGVCLVLLIALQIDHSLREASKEEPLSPEAAALRVLVAAQTRSQRAWISVRPQMTGQIKTGQPFSVELILENVGKEPATGTSHHGAAMIFDMPKQIGYAPELWTAEFANVVRLESDLSIPVDGHVTIFPGDKISVNMLWNKLDTIDPLIARKKLLIMYGSVGYVTLSETHHTWYCFYLSRDEDAGVWKLGSAPIGNNAN